MLSRIWRFALCVIRILSTSTVSLPAQSYAISIVLVGVMKRGLSFSVLSVTPSSVAYLRIHVSPTIHDELDDLHTRLYNEGRNERTPEQA